MPPDTARRSDTRRADLVAAAQKLYERKGVAATTVSDIVREAGVAQGTFYLYFASKDEVVNAVAAGIAEQLVTAVERAVAAPGLDAPGQIAALRETILAMAGDPANREVSEIYHRPENRAVHDRMADSLAPRFAALIERIVRQGQAEGKFAAGDPAVAGWFIAGGLRAIEDGFGHGAGLAPALTSATEFALGALTARGRDR